MRKFNLLAALLLLAAVPLLSGCGTDRYSMNMRAATVQSTTTVAVKATLDEVPASNYENVKAVIIAASGDISAFLDSGALSEFPLSVAEQKLYEYTASKGWQAIDPIIGATFSVLRSTVVDVDRFDADAVAIVKMGLDAAATSADTSRYEWRRTPKSESLVDKVPFLRSADCACGSNHSPKPPNRVKLYRQN